MGVWLTMPSVTLASSGDGDGAGAIGLMLLALPFIVGVILYRTMYKRYRNQDKRYEFERTTTAIRSNLRRWDTFVREKKRQRSSTIDGRNENSPLVRAQNVSVREAESPRLAQEAREAQEPRMAQEPRDAQEERTAQEVRHPQPEPGGGSSAGT